jgi:demethylmenaquinone methyltransferase/2-methoxy-6-polyprenyl-1,4-benzoquinol methylase
MLATDREMPSTDARDKQAYVRSMFAAIAPRYDLLNHLLSLNLDRRWRRQAVQALEWERCPAGRFLDLCAGTLDLAATLAAQPGFRGSVIGADFVHAMLVRGRGKSPRVQAVVADTLELPFADAQFDGATIGFGLRNLADLDQGLREMRRVLRPGARLVILEFTLPRRQPLRALYLLYFRRLLPAIGRLVSKHRTAYSYLPASVMTFPQPPALAARVREAGFTRVGYRLLAPGVCTVHWGERW